MSYLTFAKIMGLGAATTLLGNVLDRTREPAPNTVTYYPSDLFSVYPHGKPHIVFTTRESVSRDAKIIYPVIGLYMPSSISVNYGTSWEPIQLRLLQYAAAAGVIDSLADSFRGGGIQRMAEGVQRAGIRDTLLDWLRGGGGYAGAQIIDAAAPGATLTGHHELWAGRTINPHMAMTFKGVSPRQFRLEFKFMAKNREESESIKNIIQHFKRGMHPELDGDEFEDFEPLWWKYPHSFEVRFYSGIDDGKETTFMFQIDTSVITSLTVDYGGSGIPVFFKENGAPVDITMSMTLQETALLTRDKIDQGY